MMFTTLLFLFNEFDGHNPQFLANDSLLTMIPESITRRAGWKEIPD